MRMEFLIFEFVEIIFLIESVRSLSHTPPKHKQSFKKILFDLILIMLWINTCVFLYEKQTVFLFFRFFIFSVYIFSLYKRNFANAILRGLALLASIDILNLLLAFVTYPFIMRLQLNGDRIIILIHIISYIVVLLIAKKHKPVFLWNIWGIARTGLLLVYFMIEVIFNFIKTTNFQKDNAQIYMMYVTFIIFGVIVSILWIKDKKNQHDKMAELIAYEHRTREMIPALRRILQDITLLDKNNLEKTEVVLEAVHNKQDCSEKNLAISKNVASTGSFLLDHQIKEFISEAKQNDVELEIIVSTPVSEIIVNENVDTYIMMQIIGDLYRNSYKAVTTTNKKNKKILFCFGLNKDHYYQISIFDNGLPFPKYILDHFGRRGCTTSGTGNGLADILECLNKYSASFVLDQNPSSSILFTKAIYIIFNGQKTVKIL